MRKVYGQDGLSILISSTPFPSKRDSLGFYVEK
jgi:hypothetical protein